jgi:NADPH:quinone reductase-like Zn-dependent oxidoreductase
VIPGRDGAGVVDEVGEGVRGTAAGDRVFGLSDTGTTAEYVALTAWAPVPQRWTPQQAAAAGVAAETAIRVLNLLGVGAGSTLLIEGAAGGVGSAAVQIALARGTTVIGTASQGNHEYLRSLGAIPITYGPGLPDRVSELAPGGVDRVFDTVGSGSLPDLIKIAPGAGDVVTIADYTAPEHGVRLTSVADAPAQALAEAAALGAAGSYVPHVAATYPLDQLAEAHTHSQGGHTRGKLVISLI